MKITSYTVRYATDLPSDIFYVFDSIDDRFIAGFDNYKAQLQRVYVTWSRAGQPMAVSTMAGPMITSCVDGGPWSGDSNWSNEIRRARAMMEHWLSVSPLLIVHDADHDEPWLSHGFRELEPPATTQRPLRVFAYGDLPPLDELFRTYGVSWEHPEWRFREKEPPSEEELGVGGVRCDWCRLQPRTKISRFAWSATRR